jgi:hypothetical protein
VSKQERKNKFCNKTHHLFKKCWYIYFSIKYSTTTNRKNDKWQMLNFQCRQPNRTTMACTLNLALLLGHPLCIYI